MADDEIKVSMDILPADAIEVPADKAVGSWECSCGAIRWSNVRSTVPMSMYPRCSVCGDSTELLMLPIRGSAGAASDEGEDHAG